MTVMQEVLRDHLTAAERRYKQATGQGHATFGVLAVAYYVEWLMLLAPEQAAEFLHALIGVHGQFETEQAYKDATARLDRAINRVAFALTRLPAKQPHH